jgi:RecB family endonuclease NucS
MTQTIINPTNQETFDYINNNYISRADKTLLLLAGDCFVRYIGRAKSYLDWGERITIIKQDGTILVHQPIMRDPVNWQPSGSKIEFKIIKNNLQLRVINRKPPEKMMIRFRNINFLTITHLEDRAKLNISGMEIDVVNQIIDSPDLIEKGLRICKREKHVKSGIIDLYAFDINHIPVVIEVKRSIASISSVHQLRMYVNDIKSDVLDARVRGILCAPRIPDMVKHLLMDYGLEWQEVERKFELPDDYQKSLEDFLVC